MTDPDWSFTTDDEVDSAYRILANNNHRMVLEYFLTRDVLEASIETLIDHVITAHPQYKDQTKLALLLHHVTLPTLATHNLIDYQPDQKTARYTGHPNVEQLLQGIIETETATTSCTNPRYKDNAR